jgi:hypothetical protein
VRADAEALLRDLLPVGPEVGRLPAARSTSSWPPSASEQRATGHQADVFAAFGEQRERQERRARERQVLPEVDLLHLAHLRIREPPERVHVDEGAEVGSQPEGEHVAHEDQ